MRRPYHPWKKLHAEQRECPEGFVAAVDRLLELSPEDLAIMLEAIGEESALSDNGAYGDAAVEDALSRIAEERRQM